MLVKLVNLIGKVSNFGAVGNSSDKGNADKVSNVGAVHY